MALALDISLLWLIKSTSHLQDVMSFCMMEYGPRTQTAIIMAARRNRHQCRHNAAEHEVRATAKSDDLLTQVPARLQPLHCPSLSSWCTATAV